MGCVVDICMLLLVPFAKAVNLEPTLRAHCSSEDPTECILFVRKEKSAGAWKSSAM